jgi:hypothetical protein
MTATTFLLAERYRLDERIAVGGVGEVWRGADLVLERPVAVKLLLAQYAVHEEALARFRAEARNAGSLSHPCIAQVYDFGEEDPPNPPFLVLELVDGPSLAGRLAEGPLEPAETMNVVAQAAAGLNAAHMAGVVHRDIKPANMLLSKDGRVKITDFGISHAAGSAPVTCTGTLLGTPAYLAPERVAGASGTPAADLYALGIVAYECLTGQLPFHGTPLQVALAHRDRSLPALPEWVPPPVAAVVGELTAKAPRARPASAGEVAQRASRLRDEMADRDAAGSQTLPQPFPITAAGPEPQWPDLDPDEHSSAAADVKPPLLPGLRPKRQSHGPRAGMAAIALAGALAAGLVGWLLAGVFHLATANGQVAPQPTPSATAAARMIRVDGAALTGQPVREVRRQLSKRGLIVRVVWRRDTRYPPGVVVSVQPTGAVPVGSLVLLTGSARPPQHHPPGQDRQTGPGPVSRPGSGHDHGDHGGGRGN